MIQRIPNSFCEAFGFQLSTNVIIRCKKTAWKGFFDEGNKNIYGLKSFMRFYEIKIYNLIQFDYYGQNLFVVSIFRDTAIEARYPTNNAEEYLKNEDMSNWIKDQYVINMFSMEYDKSEELWSFNACKNCDLYFNINISKEDVGQKKKHLVSIF